MNCGRFVSGNHLRRLLFQSAAVSGKSESGCLTQVKHACETLLAEEGRYESDGEEKSIN